MKQEESLLLQWSDFQENLSTTVGNIRERTEFCDVTLACEDDNDDMPVAAHRIVLSSGSSFFDRILRKTLSHPQPLVFLPGLKRHQLDSILTFLYLGWARVPQEELLDFLNAAKLLGVRGLEATEEKKDKLHLDRSPIMIGEDQNSSWQASDDSSLGETSAFEEPFKEESEEEEIQSKISKSSTKNKISRKSTAPVWELMERSDEDRNIAHCNLCGNKLTCIGGTTTNMVYHVKNKHPDTKEAEMLELKMKEREKKFAKPQMGDSLLEDMILQVGERWQCKVCAKISSTREHLNKHVRAHA